MILLKESLKKKIIFILIDSLRAAEVESCIRRNLVPALEYLRNKGIYRNDCVSVFPTMTPSAISSINTGRMPSEHHVTGFVWYSREEGRIINYGASPGAVCKIGPTQTIKDLFYNLNKKHLSCNVKTIYEILADNGLKSANINYFIFRGYYRFNTRMPWWTKIFTGLDFNESLPGPEINIIGRIVPPPFEYKGRGLPAPDGPRRKYGVNDDFSGTVTYWLIKEGLQPHLTMVYLPDTDGYTHRHHTSDLAPTVMRADLQIQKILNAFESWEKALEENIFIVCGDHSQSLVEKPKNSLIHLPKLLKKFSQVKLSEKSVWGKDLAICPNERMAHIYILKDKNRILPEVVETLSKDPRVDQIMWREGNNESIFNIRGGGEEDFLSFSTGGPYLDQYGQKWNLEGELGLIDARLDGNNIKYNDYPDAFNNISSLLLAREAGDVLATARPGYEFDGEAAPTHRFKGSHGSCHKCDIVVPLIIAGADVVVENPRIIDFVPFICKNFGIESW